ncbi:VWA domain-containing protein [Urechidicola sp. KH5]
MKTATYLFAFLLVCQISYANKLTITGIVTDGSSPLPGVQITIKGSNLGVQTDFDGNYIVKADVGDWLEFSFIGFKTKKVKVKKNSKVIDVELQEDADELDEVVVVGYGAMRKESLAGSIAGVRIRGVSSVKNYSVMQSPSYNYNQVSPNESYADIDEPGFKAPHANPLSTFSIDVDKAGYSNIRRMINNGTTIPEDAVKIEEMVNYFKYNYAQPKDKHPFAIQTEVGTCPWNEQHQLLKIGVQGKEIPTEDIPASNLVFLLDVSGSMSDYNKLPLLKSSFKLLVNQLRNEDKVSIVVYAGAAGLVLPPTSGDDKQKILEALNKLEAGGSTAGGAGIELAYKIAQEQFIKGGNNRVILATDGDFNVGASSDKAMTELIEEKRESGVFLTVLGFGMGNYKDSKLETLADKGNGNHAYIDSKLEAQKVLGQEFGGTLYTIAKDVKIQVEFNPNYVQAYRLIGYENRMLAAEDFIDDAKDAGELGSGHSVTALYEIIPVGVKSKYLKKVDGLKYTKNIVTSDSEELLTVKFRYKKPDGDKSREIVETVGHKEDLTPMSDDFEFASAVALFGMQIRKSEYAKKSSLDDVVALAEAGRGDDEDGYRAEFIRLVKSYQ